MEDYYKILGIERSASKDDIKRAFRKLAHKYHPDKSGTSDDRRFKEVNEAYQVLSDDRKRAEYDTYGRVFGDTGHGQSGQGGFGGFDFSNVDFTGAGGAFQDMDLGDIFSEFFGGRRGGGIVRGRDISIDLQLSFAESIYGTTRKVLINKVGVCDMCSGTGKHANSEMTSCAACAGKGRLRETRRSFLGNVTTERVCDVCHGRGEMPKVPCKTCGGQGVAKKSEEIVITIPAGIGNGEMIRLTGRGESVQGGTSGDLYVKIHVETHSSWKRDGNNLVMDLTIKLSDALLGIEFPITLLDGSAIDLRIPSGVAHGEMLRVRGKGVPADGRVGDLYIRVSIATPRRISKKVRKLAEELREEGI